MKKLHAFTLIELLVVISIIAILAGFALPVFSRAMEKGRATNCQNNLSSIGKGIRMYLNDQDDSLFSINSADKDAWPTVLQKKYVTDWNAFRSPFDKRPTVVVTPYPISYGLNENVLKDDARFVAKWVNSPSAVILAAPAVDTSVKGKTVKFDAKATSDVNVTVKRVDVPTAGTHQSREAINVLFGDSHVEQMNWIKYIEEHFFPLAQWSGEIAPILLCQPACDTRLVGQNQIDDVHVAVWS